MTTRVTSGQPGVLVLLLLSVLMSAAPVRCAHAQDGEDLARELLRQLIDSQLRRGSDDDRSGPNERTRRRPSRRMGQLQSTLATVAREASVLTAVLNTDAATHRRLRRHLAAALQYGQTASSVHRRAMSASRVDELREPCQGLHAAWQSLAWRLQNQRGLSSETTAVLERLGRLDTQLCDLLGIDSPYDQHRLTRILDALSAELRQLSDVVRYGIGVSAGRSRILRRLHRQQLKVGLLVKQINGGVPATVTQTCQRLYAEWTEAEGDLDQYNNRLVTRHVQRVVDAYRRLHHLLRLDFGLDRRLILHLARDVEGALSDLYRSVTLEQLMNLPDSRELVIAADTTSGTLQHLTDVVERNESPEDIADALEYLNEAWSLLAWYLSSVSSPDTVHQLEGVSGELSALRQAIGVDIVWDPSEMLRRASTLEGLAEGIQRSVRAWHREAGISDAARLQQCRKLTAHCHALEQLIIRRRMPTALREECRHITGAWQQLRPYLYQCQTSERQTLDRLSNAFTSELVRVLAVLPEPHR